MPQTHVEFDTITFKLNNCIEWNFSVSALFCFLGMLGIILLIPRRLSYRNEPRLTFALDSSIILPAQSPTSVAISPSLVTPTSFAMPQTTSPTRSHDYFGNQSMYARHSHSASPQTQTWPSYPSLSGSPHMSISSAPAQMAEPPSRKSSLEIDEDGRVKSRCPHEDCGKAFKDLKAHLLTHQDERPEKCPIASCEFHKRGFARKYDRNRHLVTTHYKSTVVCGFCPGSGSATEKTFHRTDIFKRHLITVHDVEQAPPNGRKRSPDGSSKQSRILIEGANGKCSTCGNLFSSAQTLFNHLDECVLSVVQKVNPSEATNERHLASVADDEDVKRTMERHNLDPSPIEATTSADDDDEEYEGLDGHQCRTSAKQTRTASGVRDGRITKSKRTGAGITFSKGGVALIAGKPHRKRKVYPPSWGSAPDKMILKKRVLCVFDGQRRLWKDDMMLHNEHEVRVKMPGTESYITDLDIATVQRAQAFHGATEEEMGPWVPTNMPDLEKLMS